MNRPKIVIIGHVCIDHNISEHTEYTDWGSAALYMANFCQSRLGITPTVLTRYGVDFLHYRAQFDVWPRYPQSVHSLVFRNHTSSTGRSQHCRYALKALPPTIDSHIKKLLKDADIVVLATLIPNYPAQFIEDILKLCRADCLKILCPQGYLRAVDGGGLIKPRDFPEAEKIIPGFDIAVISEDDHPKADNLAKSWKRSAPGTNIIITRGAKGASIINRSSQNLVKTKPVAEKDVVDSVGCGDVFAMELAYQYYKTGKISESVRAANQSAREKILALLPVD